MAIVSATFLVPYDNTHRLQLAFMSEHTLSTLQEAIRRAWLADEAASIEQLLLLVQDYDPVATEEIARSLVTAIRKKASSNLCSRHCCAFPIP